MKWFVLAIILISLCFLLGYQGMALLDKKIDVEGSVLSENPDLTEEDTGKDTSTISPTPTPALYPTSTPTSHPTSVPTQVPAPTPILQPKFTSQEIQEFIERFAGQYGVDANVLRHIAVCESGFNPDAVNEPYGGLYQFSPVTWKVNRELFGEDTNPDLRFNAEEAVQTAAYMISQGRHDIWPNCYP
jgi:hypothetical protein